MYIERGRGKKKDVTAKRTTFETDQLYTKPHG